MNSPNSRVFSPNRRRAGSRPRPLLKAIVLVTVGAAGTLGATILYESSRPLAPLSTENLWSRTAFARGSASASLAPNSEEIASPASAAPKRPESAAKRENLRLSGEVSLGGKGLEKAIVYAVAVDAPILQQLRSSVGASVDALLRASLKTETDGNGRFSLAVKEDVEHVLLAFSDAGGPCFAKARPGTEIHLTASPASAVAGRVVAASGEGIARATVMAIRSRALTPGPDWPVERAVAYAAFHRYVETDANGAFELGGLDNSEFTLIASAPEHSAVKLIQVPAGHRSLEIVLSPAASVVGVVLDGQHRPVANALIAFQRIKTDGTEEETDDVVTDAKGSYSSVRVSAGGHALVMKVTANGFATRQVRMSPLLVGERRVQDVVLDGAAALRVLVTGASGQPLANALVEAIETDDGAFLGQRVTGADGIACFESAALGRKYRLGAIADGHTLAVVPEAATKDVNVVRLTPEGVLEVKLVGANGESVDGRVQLRRECDVEELATPVAPPRKETREERGVKQTVFVYSGLDSGVYTLVAEAANHAPTTCAALPIEPGIQCVEVPLAKGQTWTGRVVDRAGAPVAGVRVQVAETAPNGVCARGVHAKLAATTDAAGAFRLAHVPADARCLILTRAGNVPRTVFARPANATAPSTEVGEIVLDGGGSIAGRVVDKYGLPIVNAPVTLVGNGFLATAAPVATTAGDGTFMFSGVPAGNYCLDFQDPVAYALSQSLTRVSTPVTVKENETTPVTIDARSHGRIYGQVRIRGAIPAQELDVVLSTPTGPLTDVARTRVTLGGTYELPVPGPGTYSLELLSMSGPAIRAARVVTLGAGDSRAIDLDIGYASVSGTVKSLRTGQPIAGAAVRVRMPESGLWTTTTDARGRYLMDGLPNGKGTISVHASGFASTREEPLSFGNSLSVPLDFDLERRAELTVRANAPSGGPVPGARVLVWNERGIRVAEATTDSLGEVSIDTLPAARYSISVEHAQFEGFRAATDLAPGQRSEESIDLLRTGSIVVVVTTKSGDVAAYAEVLATTATGMTRWGSTDAFGLVRFDAVAEGAATIRVAGFPPATVLVKAGDTVRTTIER